MHNPTLAVGVREWVRLHPVTADLVSVAAGATLVLAFAPFGWRVIAIFAPAMLVLLWLDASIARTFWRGYLFGLAFFGLGVSWVYNSIHEFGHAPAALAAAITLSFVLFLALYPALTGLLVKRCFVTSKWITLGVAFPAAWTALEWLRSWVLTGFPWLLLGQAQVDTPLAGIIPVFGVLGASWLSVTTSGLLVLSFVSKDLSRWVSLVAIALIWLSGDILDQLDWAQSTGNTLTASLIQGNVAQELKWQAEHRERALELYRDLTEAHWDSDLIVWPETAIPAFYHDIAASYMSSLADEAQRQHSNLLIGLFFYDRGTDEAYNSLALLSDTVSFYHKRHLVPFGEFMPFRGLLAWMEEMVVIPMSDLGSGQGRPLLKSDGISIGVSICYEDAYGNEVIDAFPEANLLVNVSNDAWFGDSLAPHQHLEIARLRALETRRYLLRATNTGISAVIDPKGKILGRSPQFETDVLTATITPLQGLTPFARWGNWPLITLLSLSLLIISRPLWAMRAKEHRVNNA